MMNTPPRRAPLPRLTAGQALAWCLLLSSITAQPAGATEDAGATASTWRYGAYLDASYPLNFNFPENHQWRSKSTTYRTNELTPNMAMTYARKDASEDSRWGLQLGVQAGYDTQRLEIPPDPGRQKPYDGADVLRHLAQTEVSYLFPVGTGLRLRAGLFNSYIGRESFYAKDNPNYTRTYLADGSPYFLLGVVADAALSERVSLALAIITGYDYLNNINSAPSYGGQVKWAFAPDFSLTQNVYLGPDQADTSLQFWRFFSDTYVEWTTSRVRMTLAFDIGTEEAAERPTHPQTLWMGSALHTWVHLAGPWSVAVRPEVYWDRDGRITGSEQLLVAVTNTVEYRWTYRDTTTLARLEYRFDRSTGPQGGFFTKGEVAPGVIGLTPNQNLLLFSLNWFYDS